MVTKRFWHPQPGTGDSMALDLTDDMAAQVKSMRGTFKGCPVTWFAGRQVQLAFSTRHPETAEQATEYLWVRVVGACEHGLQGELVSDPQWKCAGDAGEGIHGIATAQIYDVARQGEA